MTSDRPTLLWRLWLLTAQVIAVSAGLLIAWNVFGPAPAAPQRADVVAVQEAPHAEASASATGTKAVVRFEAGFRAAARQASASVV